MMQFYFQWNQQTCDQTKSKTQSNTCRTICCISLNGWKVIPSLEMGQFIVIAKTNLLQHELRIYSQFFFLANVRREKRANTTGKLSGP